MKTYNEVLLEIELVKKIKENKDIKKKANILAVLYIILVLSLCIRLAMVGGIWLEKSEVELNRLRVVLLSMGEETVEDEISDIDRDRAIMELMTRD